jgi:hypothetical protein
MSFDSEEFAKVAPMIVWGVNIGYGAFLTMFSLYGLIFLSPLAIIGVILGLLLMLVAWMFLKPVRKEGWLYAFILNVITIPVAWYLVPWPLYAFPITFAVLIIIIMIIPPVRAPYA